MRQLLYSLAGAAAALALAACADHPAPTALAEEAASLRAAPANVAGAVFTSTNAADANHIIAYPRLADGGLGAPLAFATGGMGSGEGDLGSQGAVVLSDDGRWLLVVNAGSDDVSVFSIDRDQQSFALTDRVPSGGTFPVSVAIHGNIVAVLNAGMPNKVTGFHLTTDGRLIRLPNSTVHLSAPMTGPAQLEFDPTGTTLVVTEKMTDRISTFIVEAGMLVRRSTSSHSPTPFGFAFDPLGRLIVSEAVGGEPGASVLSSYSLTGGVVEVISGSVPTTQTAACWVVITGDGSYAYTTNTGSGSVSSYMIGAQGQLTLLEAVAANTGPDSSPIDMALSRDSNFLYVLTPGNQAVLGYAVGAGGTLTPVGMGGGLPESAYGLAAY